MNLFVGCKHSDRAALQDILPSNVKLFIWPDSRHQRTSVPSLLDIAGDNTSYIHFSGYKRLTKDEIKHFNGQCINIHPAPPEFPGMGGLNWAIYNQQKTFGITIHLMNDIIDNGTILNVVPSAIYPEDTNISLSSRVYRQRLDILKSLCITLSSSSFMQLLDSFPKNNYSWGTRTYFSYELDDMQVFDLNEHNNTSQLIHRIKAFHTQRFPLKLKLADQIYTLGNDF